MAGGLRLRVRASAAAALLLAASAVPGLAATVCGPELETGLAFGLAEHRRSHRDLLMQRGLPREADAVAGLSADQLDRLYRYVGDLNRTQPGTAVLIYARAGEQLCAWLIRSPRDVAAGEAGVPLAEVAERIARTRSALGVERLQVARAPMKRGLSRERPPMLPPAETFDVAAAALGGTLLPDPVWRALESVRHLVIVPVGNVGTIPFAALRRRPGEAPLVERMSVTIAPSVDDLVPAAEAQRRGLRAGPHATWTGVEPREQFLVVGNPDFSRDPEWDFPALPGAEREARAVAKLAGTTPLLGGSATADAVRARMAQADYLFFATHGVADDASPLDGSFLALTGSKLTAREIQSSRLTASLAVLSACQTGLGRTHDAGVIGLARAFRLAGVPGVVMSLWSVDDDATAYLMTAFTTALRDQPPHEALRLAMLATRKRYPEPAQWASFAYFGEPMPAAAPR